VTEGLSIAALLRRTSRVAPCATNRTKFFQINRCKDEIFRRVVAYFFGSLLRSGFAASRPI
jgi:hypothetical protein